MHTQNPRISFNDRLQQLEISTDDFDKYVGLFVKGWHRFWVKTDGPDWYQIKTRDGRPIPLSKYDLAKHLVGKLWIAKPAHPFLDFFALDIDRHDGRDVMGRYQEVLKVFGPPLVFQSSESGGLHLYYFLKKEMLRQDVSSTVGAVFRQLDTIKLERSIIEDFPGLIGQMRLPLGKGSCILDNRTLKPLGLTLGESIRYALRYKQDSRIDLRRLLLKIQVQRFRSPKQVMTKKSITPQDCHLSSLPSLSEPVAQYGTRHEVQNALIRDCMDKRGMSEDETYSAIAAWYKDPRLEHHSRDWQERPEKVLKEVDAVVRNYALKRKNRRRNMAHSVSLSAEDISYIVDATKVLRTNGRYGNEAYCVQKFLFQLVGLFRIESTQVKRIPVSLINRMEGSSKKRAARNIEFCCSHGILKLIRKENRATHSCRLFELLYQPQGDGRFSSLEHGLFFLLSDSGMHQLYSRAVYERMSNSQEPC